MGQEELDLLREVATETLIFISLPRGLILQDEIIQSWGLLGQGALALLRDVDVATETFFLFLYLEASYFRMK